MVCCKNTGLLVCSIVRIACLSHFQLHHHLASLRQKQGRLRKTLPDGFTSLLVKTCTVPLRGASWILGTLWLQTKLCGILEPVGAYYYYYYYIIIIIITIIMKYMEYMELTIIMILL